MARLGNDLILVAFFLATTIATISASEEESLAQCAEHIGSQCGNQVIDKLKGGDDPTISPRCCYKLLQTGYPCHTKLTVYILENSPELIKENWTTRIARNDKIFQRCDLLTNPGTPKFLAKCAENLGIQCGEQVYNKLIHDVDMTKNCCENLVKMGQPCHHSMAKALIRIPDMRNANAVRLLKKNKAIFDDCLNDE